GTACRGNAATTSPGRLVKRFALFTTTELFVSVRKYCLRVSATTIPTIGISSNSALSHGLGPVSQCTVAMNVAPAGETFIATVHCETGPSPWLNALFDEIPIVGIVVALTRKQYFLTLTNSSVVVNNANRFTNRPGDVVAAFPRHAVP